MGVGTVELPFKMAPFPPGEVSELLVNQPLSESLLCLLTATVTGSGVGGSDRKVTKKVKRETAETAGDCCSTKVID